jgi:hypothetical protein
MFGTATDLCRRLRVCELSGAEGDATSLLGWAHGAAGVVRTTTGLCFENASTEVTHRNEPRHEESIARNLPS